MPLRLVSVLPCVPPPMRRPCTTLCRRSRAAKFRIFAGDMVKAKKPAPLRFGAFEKDGIGLVGVRAD